MSDILTIRTSPHIAGGASVDVIMYHVILALVPVTGFAVYAFGLSAAATVTTAVATCVLCEHGLCRLSGEASVVADGSAVITGLLYGLTLPPALPLWMVAVGGMIAVGVGKHLFGGLGQNPFNPALVGRAILQAAFPVPMTTWMNAMQPDRFSVLAPSTLTPPLSAPPAAGTGLGDGIDIVTGATPLAAWKFERVATGAGDLLLGVTSGSTGETCAVLIALGGVFLIARNMMNWRIPAAILATVAALSSLAHGLAPNAYPTAEFMVLSGGLMLGAMFMATDMVGSPMTGWGCVIYGAFIGALVVVIRLFGGMPEGVMYAILLGNAVTPHIDRLIRPRVYGTGRSRQGGGPPAAKEAS